MVLPSHSGPWYSSGIFLPQPQIITIFYEYHHPKLFYDWCRDGLPCGNKEEFFFPLFCWELCWNSLEFLNSIRNKSWRKWYSWSTWTLIHSHSLSGQFDFMTQENLVLLMSIWTEFLSLATKWVLVNMNSQEWLIVKDQWCFPNVLAQLIPTHTISTCVSSLIDRNEEEL